MTRPCDGPLVWFDAGAEENGAVLECAARDCSYFIATGSYHDAAHAHTDWIKEGLA